MSISANFNTNPVLKLSQNPTEDNSKTLFEKFTNPWNAANIPLNEQGTVTAVFEKNAPKIVVDGRYPIDSSHFDAALLSKIVDPTGKLKSLIEEGKIIQIKGNSTVDQAQVILLDDTSHLDRLVQPLIRGEVANALKGTENVYLCEAHPSSKIVFSQHEIENAFAPNLKLNEPGTKDYLSGWDDAQVYKQTKKSIVQGYQQINLSGLNSGNIANMNMALNGLVDLLNVIGEDAHLRTVSLWKTTEEKHQVFPNAKIVVFGGKGHLEEKWLHEQLAAHGLRYVEITPMKAAEVSGAQVQDYYGVNKHSIWGHKKPN